MLIRIVRMTFKAEAVNSFLKIFKENQTHIRSFPGCTHLELHRDYHNTNVYITYSHWDDEDTLNAYRHSALFKGVWTETKALFAEKPVAYSHRKIDVRCEM